ncbi:DUF1800 domain-containing protein [Rivibacter subsaxonicus]|uniref:Uncharacterized protein (DUF1800 family) n=1 Tax=Rivibacter subsaxonicus TaxID=457575 RepID=A0A4Q7VWJ3_9BURK|nr:DUF1800 domain-containing protein [Rivibacter subsaxonicus]RZU01097.1 uncharacterized protein (DUF1800 family) [Rivibacter subsaxonicus]
MFGSAQRARLAALAIGAAALLAACGGSGGGDSGATPEASLPPPTRQDAGRFLAQSTFGPTETEVDRVVALGYGSWLNEQFARPQSSHRLNWDAANAELKALDATRSAGPNEVLNSFYRQAIGGEDQLRQRVAFALSQIFVISMNDSTVSDNTRGVAGYMDMLGQHAFGNYRELLEGVARHPMMGLYLSHLRNQKENASSGRVPDENFAREVMQLFSIGLVQLNADGTPKLDASGKPLDTYTAEDISGLAKVFTGWSWYGPDTSDNRFYGSSSAQDVDRQWQPMQGYAKFHSVSEKKFLGKTIAAQSGADPAASLKVALDTLAAHPNVGPFIGKQLIQRLVTSNPSPAYVARVSAVFADNGSGTRGDLKAVVRAVLLDPEARSAAALTDPKAGKLREPVLRLSAFLRAYGAVSDSGKFLLASTDDAGTQLGQSAMRSPSVFNFYRPGYVPPSTLSGAQGLAVPEMQITHESSVAGYANYMRAAVQSGVGSYGATLRRNDIQPNYGAELPLADKPAELVELVNRKLMASQMNAALKTEIEAAVVSVAIPVLNSSGSNQAQIDAAKLNRVRLAVYLALVSPEFLVQK